MMILMFNMNSDLKNNEQDINNLQLENCNDEDDDLEDGEIPSDEDDDEPVPVEPKKSPSPEPTKPVQSDKNDSPNSSKSTDDKSNKSKKPSSQSSRDKTKCSEDWAGDVEKAIKAALDEDKSKSNDRSKSKSTNSKNATRDRKRSRDEKTEERVKDHKKKKLSDDETTNEDDDEMLFVRGASPVKKDTHENLSPKRNCDHDNYDSSSSYEDRGNSRHRDNDSKRSGLARSSRRNTKNDRTCKSNKSRNERTQSSRSDRRNERRAQNNDHNDDADSICLYYMQGKCHRGDDCPYSHNALPPRKMELCKFYLMDCCAKRDKCLYMHHDFPCKFFHTGLKCASGDNCKFSHDTLNEQVKNVLLKHLETAPKEILGNFPRLSREGALFMINNTEKNLAQGQDATNHKIPSLFEVKVAAPIINNAMTNESFKNDEGEDLSKNSSKERKSSGKKTRWGSDNDRVSFDILLKSVNQFGLNISNSSPAQNSNLPVTQQQVALNFYSENSEKPKDDIAKDNNDIKDENKLTTNKINNDNPKKDVDLRQLLSVLNPQVLSVAEKAANLTNKSKMDEESDRDDDSSLVIEMPSEEEDRVKANKIKVEDQKQELKSISSESQISSANEVPTNLSKRTQELYMRIQQQQKEAEDSYKNLENTDDTKQDIIQSQEDWYSDDDDDDDDDDDEMGNLTIVEKDISKEECDEEENSEIKKEESTDNAPLQPSNIPQPAAIVDKLGDLSKIDISMEVSKLLSTIKAQSNTSSNNQSKRLIKDEPELKTQTDTQSIDSIKSVSSVVAVQHIKQETAVIDSASRDPRVSRDPRQRREDPRQLPTADVPIKSEAIKDTRTSSSSIRLETSIYSTGIISHDGTMDTDLRSKLDQDHRRKDMDLRQCYPATTNFGDTDLRLVGGYNPSDAVTKSDIDLRPMLNLPFKPVPSHIPCTEIDASISSHPPLLYKLYIVELPRPDYTGLKLTKNDQQVKYDPRLRKIFRLSKDDTAESPMSPPPIMMDTPKSPPMVRVDPRRKALETNIQAPKIIPTTQQHVQEHSAVNLNIAAPFIPTPQSISVPLTGLMNPVMGNANGPSISNNGAMKPSNINALGLNNINTMPNPHTPQNQMCYDPRFNPQRNSGVGLLGPGPPLGFNADNRNQFDRGFDRQNFDRIPYDHSNFDNYNNYTQGHKPDPRGFKGKGEFLNDVNNFGINQDWNGQNQRMNIRKDRRRNPRGKFTNLARKKDLSS